MNSKKEAGWLNKLAAELREGRLSGFKNTKIKLDSEPSNEMFLVEKLAAYMHSVWTKWFLHQREAYTGINPDMKLDHERWMSQSAMKYEHLMEKDKEKDRKFAREILKIIDDANA